MFDTYPDLFLHVGDEEGIVGDSEWGGFSPTLVLCCAERVAACFAIGSMVYLGGDGHQGSSQHPQGLLHFPQDGSFILTREFLDRLELWWWLWFYSHSCAPPLPPPLLRD